MAYTRAWDETQPLGSADADTIDTIIQNLKTDLRERLEQVIPNFDDATPDPKRVAIASGDESELPVTGQIEGDVFFADDVGVVYVWDGDEWLPLGNNLSTGLASARPNPPAGPNLFYFATDSNVLSVSVDDDPDPVWQDVIGGETVEEDVPGVSLITYTPANAEGARASEPIVARCVGILLTGTTDSDGQITILHSELILKGIAYDTPISCTVTVTGTEIMSPASYATVFFSPISIIITFWDGSGGTVLATTALTAHVSLYYSEGS